jgi:hypothetical protein
MTTLFNRWWFHIWRLTAWKAIVYLILVAIRALTIGGGMMFLLSDVPITLRAIIAAIVGVGMSVLTGILGLRARLGEDW